MDDDDEKHAPPDDVRQYAESVLPAVTRQWGEEIIEMNSRNRKRSGLRRCKIRIHKRAGSAATSPVIAKFCFKVAVTIHPKPMQSMAKVKAGDDM